MLASMLRGIRVNGSDAYDGRSNINSYAGVRMAARTTHLIRHTVVLLAIVVPSAPHGQHWALKKRVRSAIPAVKQAAWVRNPIDSFILSALERKGLSPSPPADKRTLLRRVTFDLTGLPPTPEEIAA